MFNFVSSLIDSVDYLLPLKAFVKEQVYILKESLEESADPINNNKSLISELNDQLKYL